SDTSGGKQGKNSPDLLPEKNLPRTPPEPPRTPPEPKSGQCQSSVMAEGAVDPSIGAGFRAHVGNA
ncbi:unnamed protein product, partial [marine sediment metagenome]